MLEHTHYVKGYLSYCIGTHVLCEALHLLEAHHIILFGYPWLSLGPSSKTTCWETYRTISLYIDMILPTLNLSPHSFVFWLTSKALYQFDKAHLYKSTILPMSTDVRLWTYIQQMALYNSKETALLRYG